MQKWSDYCYDECAYCDQHTNDYAWTYGFNFVFMECPHCHETNWSGYDSGHGFRWYKMDKKELDIHMAAVHSVSTILNPPLTAADEEAHANPSS